MIRTEIQFFGVNIDIQIQPAIALFEARLNEFSARLIDAETGFGFRPDQIRLKHSDILYGYELTALFFGGNASIQRTAERIELRLTGGKTAPDSEVVMRTVEKFLRLLDMPETTTVGVWAYGHSAFASAEDADRFFSCYTPAMADEAGLVVRGGALGFVKAPSWEHEIRIAVEPSAIFADGAFVSFNTSMALSDADPTRLHTLSSMFASASAAFGLEIVLLP